MYFNRKTLTKEESNNQIWLGLRSTVEEDLLLDEAVSKGVTTDARRLSRYQFEHILHTHEGGRLVLYFRKNVQMLNNLFHSVPIEVAKIQSGYTCGGCFILWSSSRQCAAIQHLFWIIQIRSYQSPMAKAYIL